MSEEPNAETTPNPAPPEGDEPVAVKLGGAETHLNKMNVEKLNLLKDVQIPLSVEIGQTELAVREILDLDRGSIVVLDKESEEPMDIRVNGRLIARGEIVVVKENFGVRITEIINEDGSLT